MVNEILIGDALQILKTLPENSVDAIVTDPPAGISFMGKEWDGSKGGRVAWIAWLSEIMTEAQRCLKPGGNALVWALPKTSHWTACALEDAGFEIRDKLYHLFASGFPKSLDISKAIDRMAGAERDVVSTHKTKDIRRNVAEDIENGWTTRQGKLGTGAPTQYMDYAVTAPATQEALAWDGWGTALKPAVEEWILCRKPLAESSVARNVLEWGCGGINIGATRVGVFPEKSTPAHEVLDTAFDAAHFAWLGIHLSDDLHLPSLSSLCDALRKISSALRSCSTACTAPSHDEDDQGDTSPSRALYESMRSRLYPNGVWCGLNLREVPGSQGDCPACSHFYGVHARAVQEAAQVSAPSLADALEHMSSLLLEQKHNHDYQCTCRPSISGVVVHTLALIRSLIGFSYSTIYSSRLSNGKPRGRGGIWKSDGEERIYDATQGRWPAHLLISHAEDCQPSACVPGCPALELDEQSGIRKSGMMNPGQMRKQSLGKGGYHGDFPDTATLQGTYGDEGGASRFFAQFYYAPKASKEERNLGCEGLPEQKRNATHFDGAGGIAHRIGEDGKVTPKAIPAPESNIHPTVKNQSLMRFLCRLITPPNGIVLDCFAGSGSTGVAAIAEGFRFIGIELDPDYAAIASARLNHALAEAEAEAKREKQMVLFDVRAIDTPAPRPVARELWQEVTI